MNGGIAIALLLRPTCWVVNARNDRILHLCHEFYFMLSEIYYQIDCCRDR